MIWLTGDQYYIQSKCGHYQISKVTVMGVPQYVCWFRAAKDKPFKEIGSKTNAGEGKTACEEHEFKLKQARGVA